MSGLLSEYFEGIAVKRLSAVEAERESSNQHELNGVSDLKKLFGSTGRQTLSAAIYYVTDDEIKQATEQLTWYDAREAHPSRSEYRLYYQGSSVSENCHAGDLVIIGKKSDESVVLIAAERGSTAESQLMWLFGIAESALNGSFHFIDIEKKDKELGFSARTILESLGIEIVKIDETHLEEMLGKFGGKFPKTAVFSEFARSKTKDVNPEHDPDHAIYEWINMEEQLFRSLEKVIVGEKLRKGFGDNNSDVDEFIQFSLSVQNRRKARVGHAFEHHLKEIFDKLHIKYSCNEPTEGKKKPDFLFPGVTEYHDENFPAQRLTMLGAKSTCKERWRQVLAEAKRIENKHLITLEASISQDQTNEMKESSLQLIVPVPIQKTYSQAQQSWLLSLSEFIGLIRKRERG